jgi:hypothetical protein
MAGTPPKNSKARMCAPIQSGNPWLKAGSAKV